jgi:galactokinase
LDELDHLADLANKYDGVYGARMMGGGFGGCVICLVHSQSLIQFINEAESSYTGRFGFNPEPIQFELGSGVEYIQA